MTRRLHIPLLFACIALLALAAAAPAGARPARGMSANVAIGNPVLGTSADGLTSILVPVRYPIELKGRLGELRVSLIGAGGRTVRSWVLHERLSGGRKRLPDRRSGFTFVHRIGLNSALTRRLRRGASVRVAAIGRLDLDEDGKAEWGSHDLATGKPLAGPRPKPVCGTVPHLRVKQGERVSVPLPSCDTPRSWRTVGKRTRGSARVRAGRLIYKAPQGFAGGDQVELVSPSVRQVAQVTVGGPSGLVVRALGDSVTAGFGYYSTGENFPLDDLLSCKPATTLYNDACSSNAMAMKSAEGAPEYAADYGLAKNVSWAAQWANEYGVTNYANFAVSGSEPSNWVPGPEGFLYKYTKQIEAAEPDYVLLTLGANPLLSALLTKPKDLFCAAFSDLKEFEKCVRKEFERVALGTSLRSVYTELLNNTEATIFVMQYHLSIPWSALFDRTTEIARANQMLNEEVAAAVAAMGNSRLQLVTPPHFDVGISIEPVYPSRYRCRLDRVDGPSVQSTGTQIELEGHIFSFCSGPAGGGPDWVINNDTGIHPSAAGYTQMASQVPAPE
jgi:lysophospholipase L1-like esterase